MLLLSSLFFLVSRRRVHTPLLSSVGQVPSVVRPVEELVPLALRAGPGVPRSQPAVHLSPPPVLGGTAAALADRRAALSS